MEEPYRQGFQLGGAAEEGDEFLIVDEQGEADSIGT